VGKEVSESCKVGFTKVQNEKKGFFSGLGQTDLGPVLSKTAKKGHFRPFGAFQDARECEKRRRPIWMDRHENGGI
jgi:hypothetical protein